MPALPIGTETLPGAFDTPGRQQAGLHPDLAGGQVVQRVISDHQATLCFDLQQRQVFSEEGQIRFAEMFCFIGRHMLEHVTVQFPPPDPRINHGPGKDRIGCQNDLPPPGSCGSNQPG